MNIFFRVMLCGSLLLTACSSNEVKEVVTEEKLLVGTTIYPLKSIAEEILGERGEVFSLTTPGASPHTFEVSPRDIQRVEDSEMVFAVGHELDKWTNDLVAAVTSLDVFVVDEGVKLKKFGGEDDHEDEDDGHGHGEYDPHYWLSPSNAKVIAGNMAAEFLRVNPLNGAFYLENLDNFEKAMDELLAEGRAMNLDAKLIVFHDSWAYFAEDFGLEIAGVFMNSPGKEPTPKEMANLYGLVEYVGVDYIFSEPQLSPEVMKPFVEDLGLNLYVMDPLGGFGGRERYEDLIRYNLRTIKEAINQ